MERHHRRAASADGERRDRPGTALAAAEVTAMLRARSAAEAHLYLELHPCACGDRTTRLAHQLTSEAGVLEARYRGTCHSCGAARELVFELTGTPAAPAAFGGAEASTIVDAGEFLEASDRAAAACPADPATLAPPARGHARATLERAIRCLDEVLKFIPDGASEVPESARTSLASQRITARFPGQFRRTRLEARLEAYRALARRYDAN